MPTVATKNEISPSTLGQQLMKPSGVLGKKVGVIMNNTNAGLYDLAASMLNPRPGAFLLEIGFGNGLFFPRFFELAPDLRIAGTDFSEVMCRDAAERNHSFVSSGRLDLRCEDSLRMSFEAGTFDWVFGLNTIYFWEDPATHLAEIRRVLKPEGRLLLGYRPKSAMAHLPFAQECFRLFEPAELAALLRDAGFIVEAEQSRDTERISADGAIIRSRDICTVARVRR